MSYRGATCGGDHDERPTCFRAEEPAAVAELSVDQKRERVERGSDQCILDGEHFFILGNVDVPIRGSSDVLRWSVWATLSEDNFARTSELWNAAGREAEPPYFSWLSNQIPGYPASVNIRAKVQTQAVGIRPQIRVADETHPLCVDQVRGVTQERAQELIHAALHKNTG